MGKEIGQIRAKSINNRSKNRVSKHNIEKRPEIQELPPIPQVDSEKEAMWEQRRYEIAKELFNDRIASCCGNPYIAAKEAVSYADIIIEELKKEDRP